MHINKLISAMTIAGLSLSGFQSTAYAEYYIVCTPPIIHYVNAAPSCHVKRSHKVVKHHRVKHHHKTHHHYKYIQPKSHVSISINYVWDMSPPMCGCNSSCSIASACDAYTESNIAYVPASKAYMLDEYDGEFDFDRRTADDIPDGMNIDY